MYTALANHSRQTGFTLVELMISLVLGLILTGGIISLFIQNQQSFRMDENVARMHDEARFALQEISRDLRMAGFLGESAAPDSVINDDSLAIATDCGPGGQPEWIYSLFDATGGEVNAITGVDNASGAAAAAAYGCIAADELLPGTDIVAIKRVSGSPVPAGAVQNGTVYLRTNGNSSLLLREPPVNPGVVPAPFTTWEYRPSIYYIRSFSTSPGDGLPALCRKTLVMTGAAPTMATDCIARGIENLQIEYGLDLNGDGSVNRYVPNPTLAEIERVSSVRVSLLARTVRADRGYTDERVYRLSNAPDYSPADNFHRRVYSTTVPVHNRRNQERLRMGT